MPRKSKPQAVDETSCALCKELESMTITEFKEHRTSVHGDKDPGHLKLQMVMHLDGTNFFSSTYEILEGKKVVGHRYTSNPRSRESRAMWSL